MEGKAGKMARSSGKAGFGRVAPALFAVAALGVPSAGLALVGLGDSLQRIEGPAMAPFTPANVDPELARRVQERIAARGKALRFTPAGTAGARDSTVTVAVRVDDQTARAISVRSTLASLQGEPGRGATPTLAGTRYNLGLARGYQSFAKPQAPAATVGLRDIAMPDLADFKPAETRADKPSRFQPRVALESEIQRGRSRGTLEGLGEQTVDVGGAYRVTRNLDVTAGVRLSQERDRIAPLGEGVEDSQAVYVGTQFRF
jgi:hypothetical protein